MCHKINYFGAIFSINAVRICSTAKGKIFLKPNNFYFDEDEK
jgi:hypothetical protein